MFSFLNISYFLEFDLPFINVGIKTRLTNQSNFLVVCIHKKLGRKLTRLRAFTWDFLFNNLNGNRDVLISINKQL